MNFSVYALDDIDDEQRSELLSKNWRLVTGGYWSHSPSNHGYSAFFITKESEYSWAMICLEISQQESRSLPEESETRKRFLLLNGDVSFVELEGAKEIITEEAAAHLLFEHYVEIGGVTVDEIDARLGTAIDMNTT